MRNTNLDVIKSYALILLNLPVEETLVPFIVSHPFFESRMVQFKGENGFELIDIMEESNFTKAVNQFATFINRQESVAGIFSMLRKQYRMYFLYHLKDDLSEKDFGELLNDAWTLSENPNQDINLSLREIIKMFKKAKKEYLMSKEEQLYLKTLPEEFTVYRGIGTKSNPEGLSWTLSLGKAEWFANRFESNGYVISGTVKKEDVLAYFNGRAEDEIVVPYKKVTNVTRL